MRFLSRLLFSGLLVCILGLSLWAGLRLVLVSYATHIADNRLKEIPYEIPESQTAFLIGQLVFNEFGHYVDNSRHPLIRLRRFLRASFLPPFLKVPDGIIETIVNKGWCDDAARQTIFLLSRYNIAAQPFYIFLPTTGDEVSGHVAVIVTSTGEKSRFIVDSFLGYATIRDGRPIDPVDVRSALRKGQSWTYFFTPLGTKAEDGPYPHFARAFMAAAGEDLDLTATLPALNGKVLVLGGEDQSGMDVLREAPKHGLMPIWHYAGHKYDRGFTRYLQAREPVKIEFLLLSPPDSKILRTMSPAPYVEGARLVWFLGPDEKIVFKDRLAGLSFSRLNSYIDVDKITVTPAKKAYDHEGR